ncbi:hypothetical protein TRFO_36965 [Tritrichomonas foetus]|uniref:Protein kinase domain-containing protein n=1 Tax=Tritrichomonas foetus TaxID=1144522 RepID=A0A1J4JGL1_9EUKA|nr:hypothetical protein TRFO_36965 [Tritrichomonas foetus]|eukprot:OHS96779.1 hypothetical protein TRFO_36965 [Tritrichomonas foetus]
MAQSTKWSLFSAGKNWYGQLGREGNPKIPKPVENLKINNLVCISTGSEHSIALYKDGSAFGWGWNYRSILGFPEENEIIEIPTKINGLPKIIDVKCGSGFTLFLTQEKKVLIASECNENIPFEEIEIGEPAVALFGFCHPWIVGESGAIYWYNFRISKEIKTFEPFPFGIPKQIVSINHSVLLITKSGEAYGMSMKKLRPDRFDQFSKVVLENEDNFSVIESLRDVKIKKVSGIFNHFLALSEDYKVFAWGSNDNGQLGVGDKEDRYDSFVPLTVSKNLKVIDIAAGNTHSILVDSSGHVWGLGNGGYGQTMLGEEEGSLSIIVDGVVAAHCGDDFSLVEIGNLHLPEAGIVNVKCEHSSKKVALSSTKNLQRKKNKATNSLLKKEIVVKGKRISELENEVSVKAKRIRELENEVLLKGKRMKELEDELFKSSEEVKTLKKEVEKHKLILKENSEMKHKIKEQSSMVSTLEKQILDLKAQVNNNTISSTTIKVFSQEEIDNFHVIEKIGRGATSKVVKISREEFYVLKILHIDSLIENEKSDQFYNIKEIKNFIKEFEILSQISHHNILKTYGICYGDSTHSPSILLEYCPTNLKKSIKKLTQEEQKQIILEIISGMSYLHENGIIHRDLKPKNILIDSEKHVKICDFGLSTISNEFTHTQGIGSLAYMSPELLNEEEHYTNKIDVYSFGIVLYFILTQGSLPKLSIPKIIRGSKIPIPNNINSFYRKLIEQCLSFAPENRPTFSDLRQMVQLSDLG